MIDKETDVKVDIGFNQLSGVKSVKLIKVRTLLLQLLPNHVYAGLLGGWMEAYQLYSLRVNIFFIRG
mgnify:CR=1 FL=1